MSFLHQHPYPPFIPVKADTLIVGTIPPPRFSSGHLFDEDVDFCYGSKYGLLWPVLNTIFDLELSFKNTYEAVEQRKLFLEKQGIGICDMVDQCTRKKIDASDLGMQQIRLRNLISYLKENKSISKILFMGGNSKNGPEYLFRSQLSDNGLKLTIISSERPKTHEFILDGRRIRTVSLISPSSAANRSIGADPYYKERKQSNKAYTTLDFRIEQFKKHFNKT